MNRRSASKIKYFLIAVVAACAVVASVFWLLFKFPWPVHLSDFSYAKRSVFVGHWPQPIMEVDLQSRKKLKRFSRTEQERRLNLKLRRMEFLSVPLFDFFLDPGTQLLSPELPAGVAGSNSIIWPSLPTSRQLGLDEQGTHQIQYVVLPKSFGSHCVEGISMAAGDELRVNVPLARNKRNVVFTVLPLTPSYMRAWLGQYSWGKQFNDTDVNRLQQVTIPINDTTAASIRILLNSGNVLLTTASVSQWDRAGRLPIQLGAQTQHWTVEPTQGEVLPADFQVMESQEDVAKTIVEGPTQQTQSPRVAESTAPTIKQKPPMEDLLDPHSTMTNKVVDVPGVATVSLGYNVLLLQMDPIVNTIMKDEEEFRALAPNLFEFAKKALAMPVTVPKHKKSVELFQHTIVRQNSGYIPLKIPIITKDILSGDGVFNLYQEFRNYGYRVASFAPPAALSLPVALSYGREVPNVDGRWLDSNDWGFLVRRRELDSQPEPASGLAAIFNSDRDTKQFAMNDQDFQKMAKVLEGLERHREAVPDWKANELSIMSAKGDYLPRLVDSFHHWFEDNSQIRSLAHVYLQNDDPELRPTFKDFLKVLKLKKIKALALPGRSERYARIVMLDRVFGELLDTLIVRRTYHRTAIAVVIPDRASDQKDKSGRARFLLGLSGLQGKNAPTKTEYSLDDALQTMAQLVGVQLRQRDKEGQSVFLGQNIQRNSFEPDISSTLLNAELDGDLEKPDETLKDAAAGVTGTAQRNEKIESPKTIRAPRQGTQVSKFRMIILPRAAGCQAFEWRATSSYFGLTASQPVVEEPIPRGQVIRVFPCGIRDQVIELSWFQTHPRIEGSYTQPASFDSFGGALKFLKEGSSVLAQDLPIFLVGPQALALDSLPLRLERFSKSEMANVFDADAGNPMEKEMLARVLNLNAQMQGAQMSAHTLVYFFREPAER